MEATVRELADRQAIAELIHAYCRHFDQNEPEAVAALFTAGATVDYGPETETIVGADTIAETIAVGLAQTFAATSHHVSNIQITFEGPDAATGVTYLYAWHRYRDGSPDGELWGRYHHRFARTGRGWRISELVLRAAGSTDFHRATMHPTGRLVSGLDERDVEIVGIAKGRIAPLARPDIERGGLARSSTPSSRRRAIPRSRLPTPIANSKGPMWPHSPRQSGPQRVEDDRLDARALRADQHDHVLAGRLARVPGGHRLEELGRLEEHLREAEPLVERTRPGDVGDAERDVVDALGPRGDPGSERQRPVHSISSSLPPHGSAT